MKNESSACSARFIGLDLIALLAIVDGRVHVRRVDGVLSGRFIMSFLMRCFWRMFCIHTVIIIVVGLKSVVTLKVMVRHNSRGGGGACGPNRDPCAAGTNCFRLLSFMYCGSAHRRLCDRQRVCHQCKHFFLVTMGGGGGVRAVDLSECCFWLRPLRWKMNRMGADLRKDVDEASLSKVWRCKQ